ncbi:SGNH/GDSL hydrolase family protein [Streptomyces sp. YC504]|uniref:SGNH/GDSL hydrolase family protein n=1 Tax=Streptomyces mesophilus TaxID=1775132 RepID=A0A6G4XKS8_9ACTN|nr:SGNH/GDSL hydrolase family protein [Streptomyces mesophilus]NGO77314.1 SGNH/GDSL hydrolase family protein [Streptomyces mesophilus]
MGEQAYTAARGGRSRRGALGALAAGGAAALVVAATAAPAQAGPGGHGGHGGQHRGERYVALGDSYTSGPGIPDQVDANCARSNRNYPSVAAWKIRPASFKDVSCGGATTEHMWQQQGTNPPQLDALDKRTTLVTVGIGGNDIGFGEIVGTCTRLSFTDPYGSPCTKQYTAGGTDQLAARIANTAPKIEKVIDAIHDRAPRARVYVVGYPVIVADSGKGCWPYVQQAEGDVPYLRDTGKRLNAMLRDVARDNRARFVDTYTPTIGHDVCQAPETRWVEPLQPTSPAAPFHPNAKGEAAMAWALLREIDRRGHGH